MGSSPKNQNKFHPHVVQNLYTVKTENLKKRITYLQNFSLNLTDISVNAEM